MSHVDDPLLQDIRDYLRASGMAPSTFGRLVLNDSSFVLKLERGADPRRSTERRVREFMRENPPGGRPMTHCNVVTSDADTQGVS